ncbi:NAD(P)-binding domain protein [Niveomyces insectorum RCEF 264]|uniref:NAD(P)-binding domain protein n=1 Tax=Niveomyces insectorum RCEF 264 TaxID=1081102 RepID=A0A162IE47_9HYPO|nr:NAD(P)-binding domain protein [Niveomyces insectorum RCEF 264]
MVSSKELKPHTEPFFPNQFIRNQFLTKHKTPPKTTDLSGQVMIVTGSNTGLGLECAAQLLSYKLSHLIMAVRSTDKGEAATVPLRRQYPHATILVWPLDMTSYDSIRAFVALVDKDLARLDVAILNAGMGFRGFHLVPSTGHEETVQVNYLSTMLLTILLLPVMKRKSPASGTRGRITISTAMLSAGAKFANKHAVPLLPSFDHEAVFDPRDIYATSKLLGQLALWKLTDIVSADDVVVNMVEPGFIKGTELHRALTGGGRVFMNLFKAAAGRTTKVGATAYIDAAVVKGKETHGCILSNWEISPYAPFEYTAEGKVVMERLWAETTLTMETSSRWDVVETWLQDPNAAKSSTKRAVCAVCHGTLVVAGLGRRRINSLLEMDVFRAAASRESGPEAAFVLVCGCMIGHKCAARWQAGEDRDACPAACGRPLDCSGCFHTVPPILAPLIGDNRQRVPQLPQHREDYPYFCEPCQAHEDARKKEVLRRLYEWDVWEPDADIPRVERAPVRITGSLKGYQPQWGKEDQLLLRHRFAFRSS